MKNKSFTFILALSMASMAAEAQQQIFNHLDFGITLGTTGIGVDLATPVTEWARLRTGFSYMPRMEVPMTFGVQVGDDPETSQSKFDKLSGLLSSFTNYEAKSEVEMIGRPNFWNWNVMVDVFPLKHNRHWHVTAGFSLGPSKVAEAYNRTESMPSLMAVGIYNNMYDKLHGKTIRELAQVKLFEVPGLEDFGTDLNMLKALQEKFDQYGRMGIHMGNYKKNIEDEEGNIIHAKGDPYIMEPNEDSMVRAEMKVNSFKPYLGIGYDGLLNKKNKDLTVGFDAGIMLWGGTPSLTTHDGTDMIHDVDNIPGKVGDYVSAIEKFKVFPLINLRIAYKLF